MRDHDVDGDTAELRPQQRRTEPQTDPAVDHALRAGRPEPLVPTGLLHLQRTAGNAGVQRLVGGQEGSEHEDEPSPVHQVVREPGEPLDAPTRTLMEDRLGHDFGDVRLHKDPGAAASARNVQAQAYTVGNHVVLGEGRSRTDTDEGRHTLAHELTHVVQQRQGPVDGTPAAGGISVSDPSDRFEREAEHTAASALASQGPAAPTAPPATSAVQREPLDAETATLPVQRQGGEEEEESAAAGGAAAPEAPAEAVEEPTDEDTAQRQVVQRQEGEEEEETPA
jgi:Domain of unknown function (DUF4157)